MVKVFFLCVVLIFLANNSGFAAKRNISTAELLKDINSGNASLVVSDLNLIKAGGKNDGILHTVLMLWELDRKKLPELNWDLVSEDMVRVEVADTLLQAESNGSIKLNPAPLHKYLTSMLKSKDLNIVRSAVLALSSVGDPGDVDAICKIAMREQAGTFRASVVSLSQMCNPAAGRAMARIRRNIKNKNNINFLDKTMRRASNFKERTGWCN